MIRARRRLLRTRPRPVFRTILLLATFLGWVLTLFAVQSRFDFLELLQSQQRWFTEDLFFVSRDVRMSDTMQLTHNQVGEADLKAIQAIPDVRLAAPVGRNTFPVSLEAGGNALPLFSTELFLEAVPEAFITEAPPNWDWQPGAAHVPILIPREFLNLYNFGFAPGNGLPPFSESTALSIGLRLALHPSNGGRARVLDARIAGFSDQIPSILVPAVFLDWANREFSDGKDRSARRLVVAAKSPDTPRLAQVLQQRTLRASGGAAQNARLRTLLDTILGITALSGLLILVVNLLLQWTETESILARNEDRISRLFLIGHTPGALAVRFILRQALVLIASVAAAALLVRGVRERLRTLLVESGLALDPGFHPVTVGVIGGLLLLLLLWLVFRILQRLTALYLRPE